MFCALMASAPLVVVADPSPPADDTVTVVLDTLVVAAPAVAAAPVFPVAPGVTSVVALDGVGGDLAEYLAQSAGLQMRRYGGPGADALPSVRGASAAQVMVLVDGLPISDAQTGVVDLAGLPLDRFASAEIHRGLVPMGAGGVGAAGAIDLRTRGVTGRGIEARLTGGSFGDRGGRLSLAGETAGGLRGMVMLHGRAVDNRFGYLDHNQTFATTADDTVRTRANADLVQFGWWGLGELNAHGKTLRASAGFWRQDAGRPGPLGDPSPHAGRRRDRWDARLTAADQRRTLTVDVAATRRREILYDADAEVGWDPPGATRARSDELIARAQWAPRWWLPGPLPGLVHLDVGGDGRLQRYRQQEPDRTPPRRERTTVSAFASLALDLFGPRLRIQPGWRWQRLRDDFPPEAALPWLPEPPAEIHVVEAISPSLGLTWQVLPGRLSLCGHWHETVREPSWVELFGQPGGIEGNRELVPEAITGRDVGLSLTDRRQRLGLRVTAFTQTTERTITWLQSSLYSVKAANIGRTQTRGVEVEARGRGPAGLSLTANLTLQKARDRGVDPAYRGKALPYLPSSEVFVRCALDRGRGWSPSLTVTHAGSNPRDRYNQPEQTAPARTVVDVGLARTWAGGGRDVTASIDVVNLADRVVYDVEGYPLPGRSLRVALTWR